MNDITVKTSSTPSTVETRTLVERELKRLEVCVGELLTALAHIKTENQGLRSRHEALLAERNQLLHKNEQAKTRVEAMITRLKALEHIA